MKTGALKMVEDIIFRYGVFDEISHTFEFQLFHDIGPMSAHCIYADEENLSNLREPFPLCQEFQNLPFSHGQEIPSLFRQVQAHQSAGKLGREVLLPPLYSLHRPNKLAARVLFQ